MSNANACICAIAKNEDLYLDEWITYHLALGFKHIFLYDNHDTPTLERILRSRGYTPAVLTVTHWPGQAAQYPAYNHFIKQPTAKQFKWVSFHDIDEFIVLVEHNNITAFLEDYCSSGAISINWLMFGTSDHKHYTPLPVTQRFQKCDTQPDQHVKTISVIEDIEHITNAHYVYLKPGKKQRDTSGKEFFGPWNKDGPLNIARINHYWCKSEGEHAQRYGKLTGDGLTKHVKLEDRPTNNDIFNSSAWDFYKAHLPKPKPTLL